MSLLFQAFFVLDSVINESVMIDANGWDVTRSFRAPLRKFAVWMRGLALCFAMPRRSLVVMLLAQALFPAPTILAEQRQATQGHVPRAAARSQAVGRLASSARLNLSIGLPLRNAAELDQLIEQIYDPASPAYRRYLTPTEFAKRFGTTEEDYQAVINFAETRGLVVTEKHSNRMILNVEGSAGDIEKTFHLTLRRYKHPVEAREFYAPDAEPSIEAGIPIKDISGLSNYRPPRPNFVLERKITGADMTPNAGSGPGGNYMGKDFRAAYLPGVSLTGSGESVALVQFDGYVASDITAYATLAGIPNAALTNVLIGGFSGAPTGTGGEIEVSLDIQMAMSMATNLAKIIVYEGNPTSSSGNDVLNRIATDNLARQVSCSWGWDGGPSGTTDQIFQQMAAQGQSFFVASGDDDSYANGAVDNFALAGTPAQSSWVTSVGGTTLTTTGPGGAYVSETVWNPRTWSSSRNSYLGSGGGISFIYSIPSWQKAVSMTANGGSTMMRNFPDVALTADHVLTVAHTNTSYSVQGTSCAAPLWAGFAALVNQQNLANGLPATGFLNPLLYGLGRSANYSTMFHDTTTGNNTSPDLRNPYGSTNQFYAAPGYDLCAGWGTPSGSNLLNALANSILTPSGYSIVSESCPNGAVDPGETVTLSFGLMNLGLGSAANLTATLLATNGVILPSGQQIYGTLASGATISMPFSFTAIGACGGAINPTLLLQDGQVALGTVSFSLPLGLFASATNFAESFDGVVSPALPSGWSTSKSGAQSKWVTSKATNDSAPNAAYSADSSGIGVNELVSPAISIATASAQLTFRNYYNLESGYDGGVLEIKIGSGSFADILAAGGGFVTGGYNASIPTSYSNPLGGRAAWSGNSGGFITTVANLPPAAVGQIIQLKWRCGTDNGTSGPGWYIDTLSIVDGGTYSCCSPSADLAIEQSVAPAVANIGDYAMYVITVSNLGPSVAFGVTVSNALPSGLSFISTSSSQGASALSGNAILSDLGVIPSGSAAFVTNIVGIGAPGLITNFASVFSATSDPIPTNNSAATIIAIFATNFPPLFLTQPQSLTASVGAGATLSASAAGTPPVILQWWFNGAKIANETNSTLTLANLHIERAGFYALSASNDAGGLFSSNAVLSITLLPVAVEAFQDTPVIFQSSNLLATNAPYADSPLNISGADAASLLGGTVILTNGNVFYSPPVGCLGNDAFNYAVTNATGNLASGLVMIAVTNAPTQPSDANIGVPLLPQWAVAIFLAALAGLGMGRIYARHSKA